MITVCKNQLKHTLKLQKNNNWQNIPFQSRLTTNFFPVKTRSEHDEEDLEEVQPGDADGCGDDDDIMVGLPLLEIRARTGCQLEYYIDNYRREGIPNVVIN